MTTPPVQRGPAPAPRSDRTLRIVALVVAGLGVLGLVAVGVTYLLDEREPVQAIVTTDDADGAGEAVPADPADPSEPVDPGPTLTVTPPQGATDDGGIPVGVDGVAGADVPADAVVVAVYLDFMCPYCALFEETNGPALAALRQEGTIVVEYHPVSILDGASSGTYYSTRAATAATLVADEAPGAFEAFTAALFATQPAEGTQGLSDVQIADVARSAGVPEEVAARIESRDYLTTEPSFVGWVTQSTIVADTQLGGLGTPTVVIDGTPMDTRAYDWMVPGELERAIRDAIG